MSPRWHEHMNVRETLEAALTDAKITAADQSTVDLARRYADLLDEGADLTKVGPLLLNALTALCMTPRARNTVVPAPGGEPGAQRSALDELRERRAQRARRDTPQAMD